jgi:hypothetical protein
MKRRISKDVIFLLIAIPVFLWCAFFISSRMENQLPAFSTINKSRSGYSVLYEAMKELSYPVYRRLTAVTAQDTKDIQIVASNWSYNINDEGVKEWVGKGGVLIYLNPGGLHFLEYGERTETKGSRDIFIYNEGKIITVDASTLTNSALIKSTDNAYELLMELDANNYKEIHFNEYHLFGDQAKSNLWTILPIEIKFIIYQLAIFLAALFYFLSKRFGKTIPLYEEVERSENEHLYSAASLYKSARCWDIILDNYYKSLLRELRSSHEEWLETWERHQLSSLNKAKKVYEFMDNRNAKCKAKEYMYMVIQLEHLKNILKKRRDSYWSTLKKYQ